MLDHYEPMYFQIDYFNIFQGSKLKILVSLERLNSGLLFGGFLPNIWPKKIVVLGANLLIETNRVFEKKMSNFIYIPVHTGQIITRAACADFLLSPLFAFFIFACLSAFFCCDCIFCCPLAILNILISCNF